MKEYAAIGIPLNMRTAGLCEVCKNRTMGWLIFCKCRCGRTHGLCYECLQAAQALEMVETEVIESEHDTDHGGKMTMSFTESTFLRCPDAEEVRVAVSIGR